jgi:PmbA protein
VSHSPVPELPDLARRIVERAEPHEQVEAYVARSTSTTVRAYEGEVESLTAGESHGVGVRVIVDGRQGFASAGSFDDEVVEATLREARENARFAEPDEWVALAEPDGVAPPDLDLDSTSVLKFPESAKIALALDLEQRARSADPRIRSVRTTIYSDGWGEVALWSTAGIELYDSGASASVAVSPLATDGDETQIGYGVDAARSPHDLDLDEVVRDAVDDACGMLGASKPASQRSVVVLERSVAAALLGIVAGMLSGEAVLKGRSPFAHRLDEQIADARLTLVDDPTDPASLGADRWDGEGLACRRNVLIADGRLRTFLQNSYTGRRSGTASTGSAVRSYGSTPGVGSRALAIAPGTDGLDSEDAVLAAVGEGFFVTSVSGLHSGVNPVSGDFSVGASGYRIRGGQRAEPFREATIASAIQRMLLDLTVIGSDVKWLPGGTGSVTLAVGDVTVSGS